MKVVIWGRVNNNSSTNIRLSRQLGKLALSSIARESGWLKRTGGKITPMGFCLALISSAQVASASLRIVAFASGILGGASVSKQALQKRINAKALEFLGGVLNAAILWRLGDGEPAKLAGFARIVVQDSTSLALPKRMSETFPAPGNQSGAGAGVKIHATYDLIGRRVLGFAIEAGTVPDQKHAVKGALGLGEGDLLIRDLGYFSVPALCEILASGVHVVTRLRLDVALLEPQSADTIDLLGLLRSGSKIDVPVLVGKKQRLPMRMVAFRLPEHIGQQRRRAFRQASQRRGRSNPTKLALELQDWQIYLTSCKEPELDCSQIRELYIQRWSIEILFKAFKSHGRLDGIPPCASESMALCLILSNLIRIALTHTFLRPSLKVERKIDLVSELKLHSLCQALGCIGMEQRCNLKHIVTNIMRHCLYEHRSRKSLPEKLNLLG